MKNQIGVVFLKNHTRNQKQSKKKKKHYHRTGIGQKTHRLTLTSNRGSFNWRDGLEYKSTFLQKIFPEQLVSITKSLNYFTFWVLKTAQFSFRFLSLFLHFKSTDGTLSLPADKDFIREYVLLIFHVIYLHHHHFKPDKTLQNMPQQKPIIRLTLRYYNISLTTQLVHLIVQKQGRVASH